MRKRGTRRKRNAYSENMYAWKIAYNFWFKRLYDMSVTAIHWDGLQIVNQSTIQLPEKYLIEKGRCVIFEDDVLGFLCLPCVGEGRLDENSQPSSYQAYGTNGYVKNGLVNGEDCVVIENDSMASPEKMSIEMFAMRLANSMTTGDINLSTHKTPIIIVVDDEQRLTAKNLLEDYEGCATKIFGNKNLRDIDIKVLDLKSPYIVDKIAENTQTIWNEWLNYLGVPSQVVQKKERMLKDEVTQTMGGSLASRVPRLTTRQQAAAKLQEVFGWDVKISYAVDSVPVPDYIKNTEGGEKENEIDLYSNRNVGDIER